MNVLDIAMEDGNDAKAKTVRDYLKALLEKLWADGEFFSGKRPFGNSGWEYDLYKPLIKAGAIGGKLDEYGDIVECDEKAASKLMFDAIRSLK